MGDHCPYRYMGFFAIAISNMYKIKSLIWYNFWKCIYPEGSTFVFVYCKIDEMKMEKEMNWPAGPLIFINAFLHKFKLKIHCNATYHLIYIFLVFWFFLFVRFPNCSSYLWFFMEPILAKADNYSFLKKLVENVKQTKDAQAPDDEEVNKVDITPPSPPPT